MAVGRLLILFAVFVFVSGEIYHEVEAEDQASKTLAAKRQRERNPDRGSRQQGSALRDLYRNNKQLNKTLDENDGRGSERPREGRKRGKDNLNIIREKLKPRSKQAVPANDEQDKMFGDNDDRVIVVNEAKVTANHTPTLTDKIEILRNHHYGVATYEATGSENFDPHITGVYCNFEKSPWKNGTIGDMCSWEWNKTVTAFGNGFSVLSAQDLIELNATRNYMVNGPEMDADGSVEGHFLYLPVDPTMETMAIKSPPFPGFWQFCKFEVMFHQSKMQNASIRIIAESSFSNLSWILQEVTGNNVEQWAPLRFTIGKVQQDVHIIIEIVRPAHVNMSQPLPHIAADNLRMVDCFPEPPVFGGECGAGQLKCKLFNQESCIKLQQVCDLVKDCDGGVDELQTCDKMPFGSYCNFEQGECGFVDVPGNILKWSLHNGPTPTDKTGPNYDHTCGPPDMNPPITVPLSPAGKNFTNPQCVGWYYFVNMNVTGPDNKKPDFASTAVMRSAVFNPPPRVHGNITSKYYNCCMIRFYYQQNGRNYGSLSVHVVQVTSRGNISTSLWFSSKDKGEHWYRAAIFLPNITTRYFIEIRTRRGMRMYSDSAIDDFSLAPECFGLNMDPDELGDYNYYDPVYEDALTVPNKAFKDKVYYKFTTCGAQGQFGPNQTMCDAAYNVTPVTVNVLSKPPLVGVQTWEVPAEGYYTIIASGASGGLGSAWSGLTQGSQTRALFELHKSEVLYILVGQQGLNACKKALSSQYNSQCQKKQNNSTTTGQYTSKTHEVKNTFIQDGGGGGGGATYVFVMDKDGNPVPLTVAAGGGGLSVGVFHDDGSQRGRGLSTAAPQSGYMYGNPGQTSGAGGGWTPRPGPATPGFELVRGGALMEGAAGGAACSGEAHGGFGGGGGACTKGGGGGGWIGGNTNQGEHGGGGYSYISPTRSVRDFSRVSLAQHMGPGEVLVVPAIPDCGCDYRCVTLNEYMSEVQCYCPSAWQTDEHDPTKCIMESDWTKVQWTLILVLSGVVMLCAAGLLCGCLYLYNTYQHKKEDDIRRKRLLEQEVQLRRLRNAPDGAEHALSSFNPHYGCEGILPQGVDVRGLPQVSRESLKLVKALGQGAFGEVYQGLYKHRTGDTLEMPVAVKTLPELSTGQAESDFLMEAAIMAKFNHPNVVHLIGVCFDRHPRFIVLELLAGGDLKNFLRENRPKLERCSTLTMKDLLLCALDVAKGCRYLEAKRFIHRDIAARNCLLTSRGPGRVAKIADFGMARDIYRADYYKKGGKALLPIKWMPPEAFLDGVFTIKTDCWSFGVLLWEVFSLGMMPYTGCTNREVMDLVVEGGRLEKPNPGCPDEIYKLMHDTWNPNPDERPTFIQLHDQLAILLQDPEIVSTPLPVIRTVSTTTDDHNNSHPARPPCDYLVPLAPTHDASANHTDCVASSSSTDQLLPHSKSPTAAQRSPDLEVSQYPHLQRASLEYGNIPISKGGRRRGSGSGVGDAESGTISLVGRGSAKRTTKFQPSKSTDRLLAGAEGSLEYPEAAADEAAVWETSFSQPESVQPHLHTSPPVDKLISIDTPQQTPTSTQPPENTLTDNPKSSERKKTLSPNDIAPMAPIASPDPPRINAWAKEPVKNKLDKPKPVNSKPLCLDAAQLEQNLNALKKNRGSVNLNQMKINTKDLNIVTPNAVSESKTIQIDPKKAVIYDLHSPPKEEKETEGKLKTSSSAASLLNGPLTDLPFADSDNPSTSSGSEIETPGNHIASVQTKSKANDYADVKMGIADSRNKLMKQGSNGGEFIVKDAEIRF